MRNFMIKMCKLRFKFNERLRNRELDKAKEHLFDEDITEYKKCMTRALHYMNRIEKITKQMEELIYGREDLV